MEKAEDISPNILSQAEVNERVIGFKVGDLVLLRSGGPLMTVWHIRPHGGDIDTVWFNDRTVQRDCFAESELIKVSP